MRRWSAASRSHRFLQDLSRSAPRRSRSARCRGASPRDIVLFAPDMLERLKGGAPVRIGSSSPRRAALARISWSARCPVTAGAAVRAARQR
jgi:hypothetical protein